MTTTELKPHVHAVRHALDADAADLSRIITEAFFDDPVTAWIAPDLDQRRAVARPMFDVYVDAFLPLGETYITGDRSGAALWSLPGQEVVPEAEVEAFVAKVEAAAGELAPRLFELDAIFEANKPATPHAHLQLLATLPERQGQGVGSSIFRATLPRLDREGIPAYLEATTERNRRLYERHGFRNTGRITRPDGPTLFQMWRDPAGA
jgi:GNAT superfamily N-acetyltransferase